MRRFQDGIGQMRNQTTHASGNGVRAARQDQSLGAIPAASSRSLAAELRHHISAGMCDSRDDIERLSRPWAFYSSEVAWGLLFLASMAVLFTTSMVSFCRLCTKPIAFSTFPSAAA